MSLQDCLRKTIRGEYDKLERQQQRLNADKQSLADRSAWIASMPELDIPEPSYADLATSGFLYISYSEPGQAQEVASIIALELGVTFTKTWLGSVGHFNYSTDLWGKRVCISGQPPADCKLEPYVVTTRTTHFRVKCGEKVTV